MSRLPIIVALLALACGSPPAEPAFTSSLPEITSRADSVAFRALEAAGGERALAELPYLRFDFGVERDGSRGAPRRHLWDRRTDDYRVEYERGPDTTVVVLFNTQTREGSAFFNGEPAPEETAATLVERAYGAFINDTYWLMMPMKMFDPGVTRTFVADSSNAETDVIMLQFADVGLTPGDTYWVHVDRASGDVTHWCMVLQSGIGRPARHYEWSDHRDFDGPSGRLRFAMRHAAGGVSVMTDGVTLPAEVDAGAFTDPEPRLQ